jgi:hypothetical protein
MDHDKTLYNLYTLNIETEKYFLGEHQKRISFYVGLISALISVTVAGMIKSDKWYHAFLLALGPVAIYVVADLGKTGTNRLYQRFLETISTLKKIEQDLGLHNARQANSQDWVTREPFTPLRWIESTGTEYASSKEWVKDHMIFSEKTEGTNKRERNYNGVANLLFDAAKWLAIVLLLLIFIIKVLEGGEGAWYIVADAVEKVSTLIGGSFCMHE